MVERTDVVVVGGGIGGASLGAVLARGGLGVTLLEATTEYLDRVRGESMQAWGVREAQRLGLDTALLDAGAHVAPTWRSFDADGSEIMEIPMSIMVPEVPGTLNLHHPAACQALIEAAADAGASVVRGAAAVEVTPGVVPRVRWSQDEAAHEVEAAIVVGADGRASGVRRRAGIELERAEAISYIAGLLVDGLDPATQQDDLMVSDHNQLSLLFHQGGGRARAYLCGGLSDLRRFAGPGGPSRFLEACGDSAHPHLAACAEAVAAGPCAAYPGDDTYTDTPFAEGVVLIGDAAGHNDPIIGQGLSIAMRDARIVADLVLDGARSPHDFTPYGEERSARMTRLRLIADVLAVAQAEDCDDQPERRARFLAAMDSGELAPLMMGAFAGPETVPDELVDPAWPDRIRAA